MKLRRPVFAVFAMGLCAFGVALIVCCRGCDWWYFPTRDEIDSALEAYQLESSTDKRVELLKELLDDLRDPGNRSQDHDVEYALSRMDEIYSEIKDEAILIAIDATPIRGAFAHFVCGFYWAISSHDEFRERYRNNPEATWALMRCEEWVISIEEMNEITGQSREQRVRKIRTLRAAHPRNVTQ